MRGISLLSLRTGEKFVPYRPNSVMFRYLGRIKDFRKGDSTYGPSKAVPCRGTGGNLPRKIFNTEVLGNGISGILRPSQGI